MAHFAHINNQGIVDQVIVIEPAVLEEAGGWPINGKFCNKLEFIQTSYNTKGGVYKGADINQGSQEDVKARLRKNYAGIGMKYDLVLDAFIPTKPFDSWVLKEDKCVWDAPVAYPQDATKPYPFGEYIWDEENVKWKKI